ncbi:hypothetical protein ACH5RR_005171 [Cinchona calisaya]|uniref:Trichome birefringence-like N-terminal domain-containing protein n=1 Tax=Cinchona calisaya TaxID=153742 RepID=A0ABD3AKF5_9GENT
MAKKQQAFPGSWWLVGSTFHYIAIFGFTILLTIALYYWNREGRLLQKSGLITSSYVEIRGSVPTNCSISISHQEKKKCNLFSGRWVYDKKSLPPYKDRNCTFMFDDLACEKYGRKDLNYQYWRWQPDDCDLPKFDAKALLNKLRDKRLVFVGDSLNRNQWVSFICLIESSIPSSFKSRVLKGNLYRFNAKEYNTSIDFYWSPLLVESNSDDPANHHLNERIVRLQSIEKHAKNWTDADILVFNSYLWWKVPTLKVLSESFETPNPVYKQVESRKCYKMALHTWSRWVIKHVNPSKTRMFWISMSPTHSVASNWGMPGDRKCYNETQLIAKEQLRGSETDPQMMRMTEWTIENLKAKGLKVDLLNITRLSEYRKDGHPTIYRKLWRPLTKDQLANPINYADCTHWCLPGVPDVWNQMLYAYLISDTDNI